VPVDVQTPVYEGPFDLLLQLILKEQVDLYEVPLFRIVDAYLAEIERMQHLDLEVATEFLLIAATLVELKCRRLLPGREDVDLDDDLALWEERDLLLTRLLECKTFKDVAEVLAGLEREASRSYPRRVGPEEHFLALTPDPLAGMDPERLRRAYLRAVTPKPTVSLSLHHVTPVRFTVAETVEQLLADLPDTGRITFRRLTASLGERLEVIVHFLAVLELYKQGMIEIEQAERFGDIDIRWTGGDEPSRAGALAGIDSYEG
jgi:segregation and condensation protein A